MPKELRLTVGAWRTPSSLRNFRRALFFTEENYLGIRMHTLPALDRIPLDDSDMSTKRFRRSEKGQHDDFGQEAPKLAFRCMFSWYQAIVRSSPVRNGV